MSSCDAERIPVARYGPELRVRVDRIVARSRAAIGAGAGLSVAMGPAPRVPRCGIRRRSVGLIRGRCSLQPVPILQGAGDGGIDLGIVDLVGLGLVSRELPEIVERLFLG